jgi:hypothetical protein
MKTGKLENGQGMVEFSLALPILVLVFGGVFLAGFYAYRAAASDWSVFLNGVASGAYKAPANAQAREKITPLGIGAATSSGAAAERQVRSEIHIYNARAWIFGIRLLEVQRAASHFRRWRFYAGPPPAESEFD